MKKGRFVALGELLILSIFVFGFIAVGCSSDNKNNSIYDARNVGGTGDDDNIPAFSPDMNGIDVVQTEADLPACNMDTKGQLFLVLESSGFQYCDGIYYQTLESMNIIEAGEDGKTSLIAINNEEPGDNCIEGGVKLDVGIDDNSDGALNIEEIDKTVFICNGASGSDGEDGKIALINTIQEPGGENCLYGGLKIEIGVDNNSNDILDNDEIQNNFYICNPQPIGDEEKIFDGSMLIDAETDPLEVAGYTNVTENVYIEGLNLTDLVFLGALREISGNLTIRNTSLTSLEGLKNLEFVGGYIHIDHNNMLDSLKGLENLRNISGDLAVFNNDELEDTTGLIKLRSVQMLAIFQNDELTSLGLDNLDRVGSTFLIAGNSSLCTSQVVALKNQVEFSQAPRNTIEIYSNKCCGDDVVGAEPYYCGIPPKWEIQIK